MAEEYFTFVGRLPDPCPGCDELVGKGIGLRGSGLNLQGAYGSTRLLADTADVVGPGRVLETVADRLPGSKQLGVDVLTRRTDVPPLPAQVQLTPRVRSSQVPEFWELKYVKQISTAVDPDQVAKHLDSRVADVYRQLSDQGIAGNQLKAAMASVHLKYDIILRSSPTGSVALDKQEILRQLNKVLDRPQFKPLRDAKFGFDISDIRLRIGDPMGATPVDSLSRLLGP